MDRTITLGSTAICFVWLLAVASFGSTIACSSLSCVMESSDLALAAVAQALALQAVVGQTQPSRAVVRLTDAALALATGLAPYSVAGSLHNYLALALFMLRVFRGIQTPMLGFHYVLALQAARVFGLLYLHGYACEYVLPEICSFAIWTTLVPWVALWIQFGFVISGILSIVLLDASGPSRRWQATVFVATAVLSGSYAVIGVVHGSLPGAVLFALAVGFDAYLARRLAFPVAPQP